MLWRQLWLIFAVLEYGAKRKMDSVYIDAIHELSVLSIECITYYGIVVAELYNNMADGNQ